MYNHEVLRHLSRALSLSEAQVGEIFASVGEDLTIAQVQAMMGSGDAGEETCSDEQMAQFLDGLILDRRGPRDPGAPAVVAPARLTNNVVLKKLRVALELREPDLLGILDVGGHPLSNRELTTLFRNPEHKHFRRCGDDVMLAFLQGLALRNSAAE